MNEQEKKLIDGLFQHLETAAQKSGPRDPAAEQLVAQRVQRLPSAPYYMAQTILVQRAALKKAQQRLAAAGQTSAAPPTQVRQPTVQPSQQSGGGFLAGAAQTAVGVAGGVIVADLAMDVVDDLAYGDVADELAVEEAYDAGAEDMAVASDLGEGDDLGGGLDDFGDDF